MDKGDNNRDCEKKSHLNRNIQFFCNFSLRTAGNSLFTAFSSGVDFFKVSCIGILIVFYSNSQIKSCLYTFLYKNHGSIWFYMCSTVQSLQTVLNGVINLLSIKNSRNILIPIDDTIDIYILVAYLVDNHIIFPYRIFIVRPKADSF